MDRRCPVVTAVRSIGFMPPKRWMIFVKPQPMLGPTLKRLRLTRGLSQDEVEKALDIDQSVLSTYERSARVPRASVIRKLNDFYEQPPDTLSRIAFDDQARREELEDVEPIQSAGIAIGPVEPEFIELLDAAFLLETHQLPDAAKQLRTIAKGAIPRSTAHEEPAG